MEPTSGEVFQNNQYFRTISLGNFPFVANFVRPLQDVRVLQVGNKTLYKATLFCLYLTSFCN